MSCKNCGKPNRYQSVGSKPEVKKGPFVRSPDGNNPYLDFSAAREKSYDQLVKEDQLTKQMLDSQSEAAMAEMSDAMRRRYIEKLVAIANNEEISPLGTNPGQAIRALHQTLSREDFSFISDIYPTLKDQVAEKFSEMEKDKIVLKKPE